MKKNYSIPTTEMVNLASQGIMQQGFNIITGSNNAFSDSSEID